MLNVAGDREAMEKVFRTDKMFQALDNETVHAINEFAVKGFQSIRKVR